MIQKGSQAHRNRIIGNARTLLLEIRQIFADCDHWNRLHPEERPIDVDPDGNLRNLRDGLQRMLDADPGVGPIPRIDLPADMTISELLKRALANSRGLRG